MDRNEVEQMEESLQKAFPFAEISLIKNGEESVCLNKLFIPESMRKNGWGTMIMKTLTIAADQKCLTLTLTVDTVWGATSKDRLRKFYKRLGFVNNSGRYKDFTISDGMYRRPDKTT